MNTLDILYITIGCLSSRMVSVYQCISQKFMKWIISLLFFYKDTLLVLLFFQFFLFLFLHAHTTDLTPRAVTLQLHKFFRSCRRSFAYIIDCTAKAIDYVFVFYFFFFFFLYYSVCCCWCWCCCFCVRLSLHGWVTQYWYEFWQTVGWHGGMCARVKQNNDFESGRKCDATRVWVCVRVCACVWARKTEYTCHDYLAERYFRFVCSQNYVFANIWVSTEHFI